MSTPSSRSLLSLRAAVVLIVAVLVGIFAGVLSYLADNNLPAAVLVGGGAAGAALVISHTLVGR